MRISILTIGAMGDTHPFAALAARLKSAGHEVRLAARPDFAPLAASLGIDFAPLGNPYRSVMRGREVAAAVGSGSLRKIIRQGFDREQRRAFFERLDADTWNAVAGTQAIVFKSSWIPFYSYAEKLGVPSVAAMLMPLTRTRAFPSFLLGGGKDRGAMIDSLLWRVTEQFVWQVARRFDSGLRRDLLRLRSLPFFGPRRRQEEERLPLLYAYSPTVLPRPADWPERIRVTGYWFADPPGGWEPPPDLLRFLNDGPPPVYVGFRQYDQRRSRGHPAAGSESPGALPPTRRPLERMGRPGRRRCAARLRACAWKAFRTAGFFPAWPRSFITGGPAPRARASAPESLPSSPRSWPISRVGPGG